MTETDSDLPVVPPPSSTPVPWVSGDIWLSYIYKMKRPDAIPRMTWWRWLRGHSVPRLTMLKSYLDALSISEGEALKWFHWDQIPNVHNMEDVVKWANKIKRPLYNARKLQEELAACPTQAEADKLMAEKREAARKAAEDRRVAEIIIEQRKALGLPLPMNKFGRIDKSKFTGTNSALDQARKLARQELLNQSMETPHEIK